MARLPQSGSDAGTWGEILNDFLLQTHHPDGQIKDNVITSAQIADGTITATSLDPVVQDQIAAAAPAADPVFTGTVTVPAPTNPTDATTKAYVDAAAASGTPDATILVKGKLQLTGDLGGTATSPTVPGLAGKEPSITATTSADYYRGDKTFQPLNRAAIGLSNVDNTSDANKPVSTATQTALNLKEPTISTGTTGQYWRGDKTWQTLPSAPVTSVNTQTGAVVLAKGDVGLGNVDNTSDANKPVSTAQAAADALALPLTGGTMTGGTTLNLTGAANDVAISIYNQANAREEFAIKRVSASGYRILGTGFQTTTAFDAIGFGVYTSLNAAQFLSSKGIFLGTSYATASANAGEIRTGAATNLTLSPAGTTAVTIDTSGKVGIGNTPAVALDVTGEIRASTAGTNATSAVTVGGTQTLTNKTLTNPVVTNTYTNKTSAYTITTSDAYITADATGGVFNVTLPTSIGKTGQTFSIKRTNSGSNVVTVNTTSSQTIDGVTTWPLTSQNAMITVVSDGANWILLQGYRNSVDVQSWIGSGTSPTAGTWTKPPGARLVQIIACCGGGGGASGRRGAAGTVRCGGGGGGAGAIIYITIPASDLGATETIQSGGGGAGGAAITTDDTNGNNGSQGGASYIRSTAFMKAAGHTAAGGGTNASGTAGAAWAINSVGASGGIGGAASVTGGVGGGGGSSGAGATGGGAGGGITTGDVEGAGGAGANHNGLTGGAAGTAGGGNGGTVTATGGTLPSAGGGGGGASKTTAGGNGGNGATNGFGGGGGGGGASLNGFNSGKGGDGSPGYIIITTYC